MTTMTKTFLLNSLMKKVQSLDQDFHIIGDEPTETKVLKHVLSLAEDKISEVKGQASGGTPQFTANALKNSSLRYGVFSLGQLMKIRAS
ncbi:hypothetical protein AZE42_12168 [Rhizopogon vesiculosus]|uniref:Uncharacterized protein n=1 Tax=Rhizopogon vesiculosus TaxID=180088 RepID=A0A1J8QC20_9AGAM|nr:hypothetical protein AZE42_12168 [Rhizopogon vesiculosus]